MDFQTQLWYRIEGPRRNHLARNPIWPGEVADRRLCGVHCPRLPIGVPSTNAVRTTPGVCLAPVSRPIRLLLALLIWIPVVTTGAQVTSRPDSLSGSIISRLDSAFAGVDALGDSMVVALRADSATSRGDSAYLRFRDSLQHRIDVATRSVGLALTKAIGLTEPIVKQLAFHGVHVGVSEGDTYFTVDVARLIDRVGPFLTREGRQYAGLTLDEQRRPCCEDAGLLISWDELGDRVAGYDRFAANYPNSAAAPEAAAEYQTLFGMFLTGIDNSPAYLKARMIPNVRESLTRYARNHRELRSGQAVADYLALLKSSDYRETPAVGRFLRDHHGALIPP